MGALFIDLPGRLLMIPLGRVPSIHVCPNKAKDLVGLWWKLHPRTRTRLYSAGYTPVTFDRALRQAYTLGREADRAAGYQSGTRKTRKQIERELSGG